MQATVRGTQFPSGWMKSGIAALALAGALAIGGVAVTVARHDASNVASVSQSRTTAANDAARRHFVEINTLPERRVVPNYRFLEMNVLPDSVVRTLASHYRFLDMNTLPGDDAATGAEGADEVHLREINLLPGDDTGDVAPWSDTDGAPY